MSGQLAITPYPHGAHDSTGSDAAKLSLDLKQNSSNRGSLFSVVAAIVLIVASFLAYLLIAESYPDFGEGKNLRVTFIGLIICGLISLVAAALIGSGSSKNSKTVGIATGLLMSAPWIYQFCKVIQNAVTAFS